MKFKVGDRVKYLSDPVIGEVKEVNPTSNFPFIVNWENGAYGSYSNEDCLQLIQPEPVEITYNTSEVYESAEKPQEPIPGKFYKRAGNGEKLKFLMKAKYWLYEAEDGHILKYNPPPTLEPWVDEVVLPAEEIKRWSLICNEDYKHWKRGEFRFADNSIQEIEKVLNVYVEKEERKYWEIVELTGTLPERKVT